MGAGIIIADTAPEALNRYTWMRPMPDGSCEWYEPSDGGWQLTKTIPTPAAADHTHSDIKVEVKAGSHYLTFENGILIKAEEM